MLIIEKLSVVNHRKEEKMREIYETEFLICCDVECRWFVTVFKAKLIRKLKDLVEILWWKLKPERIRA